MSLTEDANIDIDASSEADVTPEYNLRKNTRKDYLKLNYVSENVNFVYTTPQKVTPKYASDSFDEYEIDDALPLVPPPHVDDDDEVFLKNDDEVSPQDDDEGMK